MMDTRDTYITPEGGKMPILRKLGSESTAHGVSKIANSKTRSRRQVWSVILFIGIVAAVSHVSVLLMKFLSYKIIETSEIKESHVIQYPSITLCNTRAVSNTELGLLVRRNPDIVDFFRFILEFENQNKEFTSSFETMYANLANEMKSIGFSMHKKLKRCKFQDEKCFAENFTLYHDLKELLNCYTFNPESSMTMRRSSGPTHGLSLILTLDEKDVFGAYGAADMEDNIGMSTGIRVQIHAPGSIPNPSDNGFDIPPGYSTSVGIRATMHSKLPAPYSNCTTERLRGSPKYLNTLESCMLVCKQEHLINTCGCKSSSLPVIENGKRVPFCKTVNWKQKSDYSNFTKKILCEKDAIKVSDQFTEEHCKCYQSCNVVTYTKTLSSSYWPSDFYKHDVLEKLIGKQKEKDSVLQEAYDVLNQAFDQKVLTTFYSANITDKEKTDIRDYIANKKKIGNKIVEKNLLRLNVYFESLDVFTFSQSPAYEFVDLLADFGGTLSLWMGVSILSVVELFELLYVLALYKESPDQDSTETCCK